MGSVVATTKAGFWIRAVAIIIDYLIYGIPLYIIAALLSLNTNARSLISLIVGIAYFVYFWSEAGGGQTLGMRIFNLKVVKTDGSLLNYTAAFIRSLGLIVSEVVFLVGVIWAAFDPNKQGWHDKIAGTYVVKASAAAQPAASPTTQT